ncbi:MAG: UDP-N-acetylmuramoyl-tripeptide--D-alanyl-D-alanine ligase [Gammaproteobacteria bacterium]|nr:UDP-N-acetylmuramoyl-tripeptide--D-alanyl-D-alanine ligase [Gammaproteobacteria bacterium]
MIGFRLSEIASGLSASHTGDNPYIESVSTDTRHIRAGDLFVALRGPRFDGHDYLSRARDLGASGFMVCRAQDLDTPSVEVPDTRIGLGKLAGLWRQASGAALIAVTGSNGKTTVKEMIASILSQRGRVLATRGNLNNDIGVPLTLMGLQDEEYAVVEMGANHVGEIDYLSRMARPDVAVLTNAGSAHLEGFGNVEGVAHAKAEILNGLSESGCFVLNADDVWAPLWKTMAGERRVCTFGVKNPADVSSRADRVRIDWDEQGFITRFPVNTPAGELEIELSLAGGHNRLNALAAIAAAQASGMDLDGIQAGLAALKPVKGRLKPVAGRKGVSLIDDSYNANPDSVTAAIDVLASAPGRRFLVLGELAELGNKADDFYRILGDLAKRSGVEHLYAVGPAGLAAESFGSGGLGFQSRDALIEALDGFLHSGDRVLIKGSRSAGMERVVESLAVGGEY